MKQTLSGAVALASMVAASGALAEVNVYGKANVTFESVDINGSSTTELVSNASRLGFEGSEEINEQLKAIYQLEYEVYFDDADTFKQRNIFIGVEGGFGQVIGGHFDTPFKAAQNKIDVFNDLRGDIKHVVSPHENRESNTLQYTTPEGLGGFRAALALINSEDEELNDGKSVALAWSNEHIYVAAAMDQDVEFEGVDAMRLVLQYNRGGWQLGALYEETDADFMADAFSGYAVSLMYKLSDVWSLRAQHGASDGYLGVVQVLGEPVGLSPFDNAETTSIGADYKLSKNAKLFGFYTMASADAGADADALGFDALDNDYLGIGMELKF